MEWIKLLENPIAFEVDTQVLPTKGNLVYEYNAFRNFRLNQTMFEYKGEYYTQEELKSKFNIEVNDKNNPTIWYKNKTINSETNEIEGTDVSSDIILHEKGELVDFITDELSFSINAPVNITPQYSYDGSVNLILNDGINIPRMINSRFSATGKNTYEIVNRKGNNDTNIYDQGDQFDIDTSLYKRVIKIPKILFQGVQSGGNLKVGNYHLYFKLSDADGNETDFVGETSLISVFIGFNDPHSVNTGIADENSYKSIKMLITNIDTAYSYVTVYYSRYTADGEESYQTEYAKIDKKFVVNNSGACSLLITGFEEIIPVTSTDINRNYNIVDSVKTSTSCQNMLFLGNVHKPDIPYKELADLSLHFLPYLKQVDYQMHIDEEYNISTSEKGYYDPKFIYDKVGYWGEEIYRFGVVYILPNNELTPVFNVRGADNIFAYRNNPLTQMPQNDEDTFDDGQFTKFPVYDKEGKRCYIEYNENNYQILQTSNDNIVYGKLINYIENVKGVVRFRPNRDANTIYGVDMRIDNEALQELKKYVKGYFFVRQTRIPTILAQGITIGIDQNSYTPCLATAEGNLYQIASQLAYSHVATEDINDVNYISEGFLKRYSFKFEKKRSGLFGSILKGMAIAVGVVAIAAATVFTAGAAGAIIAGTATTLAGAMSAGISAVAVAAGVGGMVVGATAVGAMSAGALAGIGIATLAGVAAVGTAVSIAALGAVQDIRYGVNRMFSKCSLNGRNTQCPSGYKIVENDDSRHLSQNFSDRIIIKDPSKVKVQGILCPDYEVNQAYYNSIFTGNTHRIGLTNMQSTNGLMGHSSNYFTNNKRHFYIPSYYDMGIRNAYDFKIVGVPDDTTLVGIDNLKFRSRAGSAEEAWTYECIGDDYKSEESKRSGYDDETTTSNKEINSDIVRGSYGPYLAFNDNFNKFSPAETVNIYIPEYSISDMSKYFEIRMQDNTPFEAISDRIDISESDEYLVKPLSALVNNSEHSRDCGYTFELYRGDCYICQFTHRMHRNFQDPGAPYNDEIVQKDTWKEHYKPAEPENYNQINLGDINAIKIGTWATFTVRSSFNLNIRTLDKSNVTETEMTGHPHGYYPYNDMSADGVYKHPESMIYNKGFSKSLSERLNMELPDVPHIKNWFGTRIMYSDIHINDAYKNGYRVFKPTAYRDYTREYGEIVKLVTLESDIICIFEHGVARLPINREQVAKQVQAGNNQVTSFNVLPEAPIVLSDMFGSQWADSILKTPGKTGNSKQYIYGVDTVAKKIWRTDGATLECISDFKVQEFLNNNITLGERENTPILGIRNVKTVYNAYKRDVMFTFYDNTYGFEEKVWNLCWNELLEKFITFYSWVPSFMENINNVPFSFDRNVSKWIAKLGTSHSENSFADGITLTNTIVNNYVENNKIVDSIKYNFTYKSISGEDIIVSREVDSEKLDGFIGVLGIANRILPENLYYTIEYELERDPWGNYKNFEIKEIEEVDLTEEYQDSLYHESGVSHDDSNHIKCPIYGLYFKSSGQERNISYVYTNSRINDQYAVYSDEERSRRVYIDKGKVDPEILMTELYYRNSAGHAYADYDINKVKFTVDNLAEKDINALDPLKLYNIEEVMEYVASKWFGSDTLPSDTLEAQQDTLTNRRGESLLTRSDGPFEYDTKVYLKGYKDYYACSGGLGDLIDNRRRHAPFADHFMYGTFIEEQVGNRKEVEDLPIFKDITGKRPMLPKKEQINPDKIVTLLNIRATIKILDANNPKSLSDTYYNMKAPLNNGTSLINAAQYESVIGITTKWNMQFLTSDFWKHGQAGLIDIADDIYPTYWYGRQHPFEFECVVVDDPSLHKIFTNLELVANKAKPDSFHYEVVGEAYDFAKDKVNMYFRQEAMKALWQYNGADITYDRNFLKVQPRQQPRSADFVHRYYTRQDTINDIEDYYIHVTYPEGYDYRHLSGAEIVYYPTRQEFRVWNHTMAVDINDLSQDDARSIISANCHYLEDRWKVTINPILICYKNEYEKTTKDDFTLIHPQHSTWAKAYDSNQLLPLLPIMNSPIPDVVKESGQIAFPGIAKDASGNKETNLDRSNALYHLYDLTNFGLKHNYKPLDTKSWLDDVNIYRYDFGGDHNRKEIDVRDKFVKIRIRYTGEELAVIDFLNTIYQVSYA